MESSALYPFVELDPAGSGTDSAELLDLRGGPKVLTGLVLEKGKILGSSEGEGAEQMVRWSAVNPQPFFNYG